MREGEPEAPLRQRVCDRLEGEISRGEWPPGTFLPSEAKLCGRFGVSRITVRSAIQMLESKGLVRTRKGKGTQVVSRGPLRLLPQEEEIRDGAQVVQVLELRLVFEKSIAGLAAERITPKEVEHLEAIWRAMGSAVGDPVRFADLDSAFHQYLGDITKNPFIIEACRSMRVHLASAMRRIVAIVGTGGGMRDHALLLDALKAHDKARAEAVMARHIDATIDAMKRYADLA